MVNWLEFGQLVRVAMEMEMKGRNGSEVLLETANSMCRELGDSFIYQPFRSEQSF
jgi:hypothetical protein